MGMGWVVWVRVGVRALCVCVSITRSSSVFLATEVFYLLKYLVSTFKLVCGYYKIRGTTLNPYPCVILALRMFYYSKY